MCFDEYMDEDEEINIVDDGSKHDAASNKFDRIVGCLEGILMDPEFEEERESFCRGNCHHFEDNDENKFIYTDLFDKYTSLVEGCIDKKIKAAIPEFDLMDFMSMLEARKDQLYDASDVFDLLLSMGDFASFKETMLAYKKEVQDAENMFRIDVTPARIHSEDQEDGEERPELDFCLQISPAGGSHPSSKK